MPPRKSKGKPGPSETPSKTEFVPVTERLRPLFERHGLIIALLLVAIGSARIVSTYWEFSQTSDEPAHIACGMEWLDHGKYTTEAQHPPLARVAAALGPYLMGSRSPASTEPSMYRDGITIYYETGRYDNTLAASRAGVLPFFWVACAVVYLWARRDFGAGPAVLALFIFSMLPPVLAHAGLGTTDMALTAFVGAAFFAGREWIERPSTPTALWFGIAGALAILSKFSSLPFFLAAAVLALVWYLVSNPSARASLSGSARDRLPTFAIAAAVTTVVVWAGYRFSFGSIHPGGIAVPAPELFRGIGEVLKHNQEGHDSYLFGTYSRSGFWSFYLVVLAVKTPLPVLILAAIGIVFAVRRDDSFALRLPIAFSAAVLAVGLVSRINIGVRHILPIYTGLSILASFAAWQIVERSTARWKDACVVALVGWLTVASLLSHPDYLPYFNEIVTGPPEEILVDSDLDWCQDQKRLSRRLRQAGASSVTFTPMCWGDWPKELPPLQFNNGQTPYQGWNAISIQRWKVLNMDLPRNVPSWPSKVPPQERIGKGILLWYFPPSSGLPIPVR